MWEKKEVQRKFDSTTISDLRLRECGQLRSEHRHIGISAPSLRPNRRQCLHPSNVGSSIIVKHHFEWYLQNKTPLAILEAVEVLDVEAARVDNGMHRHRFGNNH